MGIVIRSSLATYDNDKTISTNIKDIPINNSWNPDYEDLTKQQAEATSYVFRPEGDITHQSISNTQIEGNKMNYDQIFEDIQIEAERHGITLDHNLLSAASKATELILNGELKVNEVIGYLKNMTVIQQSSNQRQKRKIVDWKYYWPNGIIPYEFGIYSSAYRKPSQAHQILIKRGMDYYERHTCIRFYPKEEMATQYISSEQSGYVIFSNKEGCYAAQGYRAAKTGQINNPCDCAKSIMHELGHTIGLYHEQERPDNMRYVKTFPENSLLSIFSAIKQQRWVIQNVEYDVSSVMQYYFYTFTKKKKVPTATLR